MAKRSGDRLYRKTEAGTFYGWFFDPAKGKAVYVCTHTRDREAARSCLRKLERDAFEAHASGRAASYSQGHTVAKSLEYLVEKGCNDVAAGTLHMYAVKAGHLLRLLGSVDVNALTLEDVQSYIETRRGEGAHPETIRKELVTLRQSLKLARDRKLLQHDPRGVFPRFRVRYVPRDRHLTPAEASKLVKSLSAKRRLWVLLAVYTGPRLSELEALRWERDVDLQGGWILLPGTKTAQSRRKVRIPDPLMPHLVAAEGDTGPVVEQWRNVRRDLRAACKRAGIAPVSANDLRRTFASWMKQRGEDSAVVAKLMGHSSTRMVDLVYGRLNEQNYIQAAARLPGFPIPDAGSASVVKRALPERTGRALRTTDPQINAGNMVPGGGIEPPTRGFSVPCSTY